MSNCEPEVSGALSQILVLVHLLISARHCASHACAWVLHNEVARACKFTCLDRGMGMYSGSPALGGACCSSTSSPGVMAINSIIGVMIVTPY